MVAASSGLVAKTVSLVQARSPAAVRVACPRARNVQLAVHCSVSAAARVDEMDGDLGVLNPAGRQAGRQAGGAGALALHLDGVRALLHIPGLVDDE